MNKTSGKSDYMLNQQGRSPLEQARPNFRLLPNKNPRKVSPPVLPTEQNGQLAEFVHLYFPRAKTCPQFLSFLPHPSPLSFFSQTLFFPLKYFPVHSARSGEIVAPGTPPPLFCLIYWGEALIQLGTAPKFHPPHPQRGEIFTVAILVWPAVPSNEPYSSKRRLEFRTDISLNKDLLTSNRLDFCFHDKGMQLLFANKSGINPSHSRTCSLFRSPSST